MLFRAVRTPSEYARTCPVCLVKLYQSKLESVVGKFVQFLHLQLVVPVPVRVLAAVTPTR